MKSVEFRKKLRPITIQQTNQFPTKINTNLQIVDKIQLTIVLRYSF